MIFQQILNEESGCLSYLIGCGEAGKALVVDPGRDRVPEYLRLAAQEGPHDQPHPRDAHARRPHLGQSRPGRRDAGADPRSPGRRRRLRAPGRERRRRAPDRQRRASRSPTRRATRPTRSAVIGVGPVPWRGAVVRADGRHPVRRLRRTPGSRRRPRGGGRLGESAARAAAARRQRRGLSGPRRRLGVRQGDVGQVGLDDRLRAPLQPGAPASRPPGVRRLPHEGSAAEAAPRSRRSSARTRG